MMATLNQTERNMLAFAFKLLRQHYHAAADEGIVREDELAMTLVTVDELERKVTPQFFSTRQRRSASGYQKTWWKKHESHLRSRS